MGFPDQITRQVEYDHPPATVWAALTTADGLGSWLGDTATLDLRPGGTGQLAWDGGHTADLRVERVEEPTTFGFTWRMAELEDDDPRRTYVEFTLEPSGSGTRVTVVESGFAQLGDEYQSVFDSHTEGWPVKLDELGEHLDAG